MNWRDRAAPSLDDFHALAREAFEGLAEPFRRAAGEVEFHVQEFADAETLAALGIEDPFELSGLYSGVDLIRRSVSDPEPGSQPRLPLPAPDPRRMVRARRP